METTPEVLSPKVGVVSQLWKRWLNHTPEVFNYQATLETPLGMVGILSTKDAITGVHFLKNNPTLIKPKTWVAKEAVVQLQCYFADPRFTFDIPLQLNHTQHVTRTLDAVRSIPSGETLQYGALAKKIGSGPRAVGRACRYNPTPILIPCHRVVAKNHHGGYLGDTEGELLKIKEWLLQHERK